MNTKDKVLKIIKEATGPKTVIELHHTLQDLNMDSLDVVELAMDVEDEFNIIIEDELLDSIVTIEDLIKVVEQKV